MWCEVDGVRTFVGTGSGRAQGDKGCVLFVHGAGMDHSVWVSPARYFARHGYRVLAPDLPAHGRSLGEPLQTVEAMAAWCLALLDACGVDRTSVVGHSMGSLVVHALAQCAPERLEAVALLGTASPMAVTPLLLDAAADNDAAAYGMANHWSHSARGRMGGNPQPGVWVMAHEARLLDRNGDGVYHADLSACNAYRPAELTVAGISRALVLVGTEDQMTPPKAAASMVQAFAGADVVTLPGSGHSMLSEAPNQVLDALRDLLSGNP